MSIPYTDYFTEADCITVLRKATGFQNVTLENVTLRGIDDKSQGFIGQHLFATANYHKDDNKDESLVARFFVKEVGATVKAVDDIATSVNAVGKEYFFYFQFLDWCQDMNMVDLDFAPDHYLYKEKLFILQDMSESGYKTGNQFQFLDLQYCKAVLDSMAKLHASFTVLNDKKPSLDLSVLLTRLAEGHSDGKENAATRWFSYTFDGFMRLIDLMDEDKMKQSREEFKKLLSRYIDGMMTSDLEKRDSHDFKTMLHNDLWCNNIMYKYDTDKTTPSHCKIIDYQVIGHGLPSVDFMCFLATNTSRDFRSENIDKLQDYYYQQFSKSIENNRLDMKVIKNFSLDEFKASCERVRLGTKIKGSIARTMTFTPKRIIHSALVNPDDEDNGLAALLYQNRPKQMVEAFQTDDFFRTAIEEDLIEISELLFVRFK